MESGEAHLKKRALFKDGPYVRRRRRLLTIVIMSYVLAGGVRRASGCCSLRTMVDRTDGWTASTGGETLAARKKK